MKNKNIEIDKIVSKICYMCSKTYPEDVGLIDCSRYHCEMIKKILALAE